MVTADLIPQEQEVFNAAWELLKEAYDMKDVEQNWSLLVNKAEETCLRYKGTTVYKLSAALMSGVVTHIEVIKQEEKKGGAAHA